MPIHEIMHSNLFQLLSSSLHSKTCEVLLQFEQSPESSVSYSKLLQTLFSTYLFRFISKIYTWHSYKRYSGFLGHWKISNNLFVRNSNARNNVFHTCQKFIIYTAMRNIYMHIYTYAHIVAYTVTLLMSSSSLGMWDIGCIPPIYSVRLLLIWNFSGPYWKFSTVSLSSYHY